MDAIARFEKAYIMTFRISRLAFGQFHPEIKLKDEANVIFQGQLSLNFRVVEDEPALRYHQDSVMTKDQFAQTTFFKKSMLAQIPECIEVTSNLDVISDIFDSQAKCSAGKISFGVLGSLDPCFYQHTEENRRKVIVPTKGTEFASLFFIQEKEKEGFLRDYKKAILRPACPQTPKRYKYDEIEF